MAFPSKMPFSIFTLTPTPPLWKLSTNELPLPILTAANRISDLPSTHLVTTLTVLMLPGFSTSHFLF